MVRGRGGLGVSANLRSEIKRAAISGRPPTASGRVVSKLYSDYRPLSTSHEGVLRIGDVEIPCAVLEDGRRVLTQSGVMKAMGRARQAKGRQYYDSDDQLPAFLQAKNLKPFVSSDLVTTSKHIEFRTVRGAVGFGYAAELLPKVCDVFVQALDARPSPLKSGQMHIAERAKLLIRALAQTAIVALVDEATGYQEIRPRDTSHRSWTGQPISN